MDISGWITVSVNGKLLVFNGKLYGKAGELLALDTNVIVRIGGYLLLISMDNKIYHGLDHC